MVGGVVAKQRDRALPRVVNRPTSESPELLDETEMAGLVVSGDYSNLDVSLVDIAASRIDGAQLTGSRLLRSRLTDCVVVASDLSGVLLDECSVTRVEFHGCRLSGLQALGTTFRHVGFFGCKLVNANFRMTSWERSEFRRCDLVDADFYGATLPESDFSGCDLSGVQLSKADLGGSRLNGSTLDRLRGADALRGVTISSDQIIPAALAVFATLNIDIDDGVAEPETPAEGPTGEARR